MSKAGIHRFYEAAKGDQGIRERLIAFQSTTPAAFYARTLGFDVVASDFEELSLDVFKSLSTADSGEASMLSFSGTGVNGSPSGNHRFTANRQRYFKSASSSFQGLLSGLAIGFFGQPALPFLLLTIPLDRVALYKWRIVGSEAKPKKRFLLVASAFASMGINAMFSLIGISVMASVSPIGNSARQQYFKVMGITVVGQNADALDKQSRSLLDAGSSHWLNTSQKSQLVSKLKTIESVKSGLQADKLLYQEGYAVANERIDDSAYKSIILRANAVAANSRAALILSAPIRERIAQKAQEALAFAETKEKERIALLPKKYEATLTNCFVDAPCESFERVAVVAGGKITVGDFTCLISGQGPDSQGYGACSVVMTSGRPVSMRQWDPTDGFETTRVSFRGLVKDGTYDPEKEANPYIKLQRDRVAQVMKEWGREKENVKKNCKGLKGDAWTACAGEQTGD